MAVALAAAVPSSPAWAADGGGAASPPAGVPAPAPMAGGGGTAAGQVVERPAHKAKRRRKARKRRRPRGPVLDSFSLTRPHLFLYGRPARVRFRLRRGPARVRLRLVPHARGAPVRSIALGELKSGSHSFLLTGREAGVLPQGAYVLRIAGRDRRGRPLRRAARVSSSAELSYFHHRFPLAGPFSYGGPDSRFGAPRPGHSHQGQDLAAAAGTPVVAPRGGLIEAVQYQASGAGNYVVLDGEGESRDYVFMHLRTGSVVVKQGQRVRTGQRIGDVGSTGESSGPHLHFEVWDGPWYAGGHPIDPLPLLRVWDSWS
jgi:murein DD-endopeptidase MepM/ murein hydrolase activator NlpD